MVKDEDILLKFRIENRQDKDPELYSGFDPPRVFRGPPTMETGEGAAAGCRK